MRNNGSSTIESQKSPIFSSLRGFLGSCALFRNETKRCFSLIQILKKLEKYGHSCLNETIQAGL